MVLDFLVLKRSIIRRRCESLLHNELTSKRISASNQEFIRINKDQAFLMNEIQHYSMTLCKGVSLLFLCDVLLIVYTTYLNFFTRSEYTFLILFSFISFVQLAFLVGIIWFCSRIADHNTTVAEYQRRFYNVCSFRNLLSVRHLIKTQNSIQSLRNYSSGWRIENYMIVDSASYYVVSLPYLVQQFSLL